MEIRQYQVYKFEELSKESKEKAIEKWYEGEDYPWLEDDLLENVKQLDTFGIFSDIKLSYSLSYCQGDGLSFSAQIDLEKWLKAKHPKFTAKYIQRVMETVYKFHSTGNTDRYCYCSGADIEWDDHGGEKPPSLYANINKYRDEIAEYYVGVCKRAERAGYRILEYRMDEEEFEECCEANGYVFLEDGTMD